MVGVRLNSIVTPIRLDIICLSSRLVRFSIVFFRAGYRCLEILDSRSPHPPMHHPARCINQRIINFLAQNKVLLLEGNPRYKAGNSILNIGDEFGLEGDPNGNYPSL